jgi:three-Cys-motif partner protein
MREGALRQGETKTRGGQVHRFGGDWTDEKLAVIAHYLASYTTALKDKPSKEHPFRKGYVDAFAGTGYRFARLDDEAGDSQAPLLPDLAEKEPQALLDGSARIALKTEPRFDRYVFIERSAERCAQLEALKLEFPHLASGIYIRHGDANAEIQICVGGIGARIARFSSSIRTACRWTGRPSSRLPRRRRSIYGCCSRSALE